MSWSSSFDFIVNHFIEIVIFGFLVSFITYFIVKPYIKYQSLREELSKTLYKYAPIVHHLGLPQEEYNEAYDELKRMGGEITGFINSIKIECFMRLLNVPNKNDMKDGIGKINRVTNSLNDTYFITLIPKDYKRIMEIFKIE